MNGWEMKAAKPREGGCFKLVGYFAALLLVFLWAWFCGSAYP